MWILEDSVKSMLFLFLFRPNIELLIINKTSKQDISGKTDYADREDGHPGSKLFFHPFRLPREGDIHAEEAREHGQKEQEVEDACSALRVIFIQRFEEIKRFFRIFFRHIPKIAYVSLSGFERFKAV